MQLPQARRLQVHFRAKDLYAWSLHVLPVSSRNWPLKMDGWLDIYFGIDYFAGVGSGSMASRFIQLLGVSCSSSTHQKAPPILRRHQERGAQSPPILRELFLSNGQQLRLYHHLIRPRAESVDAETTKATEIFSSGVQSASGCQLLIPAL